METTLRPIAILGKITAPEPFTGTGAVCYTLGMTKNENTQTAFYAYVIERNDNDGQGWYMDTSYRSMLTRKEAAELASILRKTMHKSIDWTVRTVVATPNGWFDVRS